MEILIGILIAIAAIPFLFIVMMLIITPTQVNVSANMEKIMHRVLDERDKQLEFREYQKRTGR